MSLRLVLLLPFALTCVVGCPTSRTGSSATPLENRNWRLVEVGSQPATSGPRGVYLQFASDSARVTGSTGCNQLTGPFMRDGSALTFGAMITTKMACVDPRLNQQEHAFLAALQATQRYEITGDTLILIGAAGPVARLAAGAAS